MGGGVEAKSKRFYSFLPRKAELFGLLIPANGPMEVVVVVQSSHSWNFHIKSIRLKPTAKLKHVL